jgi:ATP-dependent Clp protease, protease subunit
MLQNNFNKFSKSLGVNSTSLDKYSRHIQKKGMTPMVITESNINASTISVFDRLMMDRIIFLGTEIDDYVANIINAQLLFLENEDENSDEPIWMYINSPGGDCYSGLAIYDTIQFIGTQVNTCVMGIAASMAFLLAISGERGHRYALKHSRLMMHQPWQMGGGGQATDVDIANREMQELKSDLINIISEHTGQDVKKVRKDAERDFWFSTQKAVDYGCIDKILTKPKK